MRCIDESSTCSLPPVTVIPPPSAAAMLSMMRLALIIALPPLTLIAPWPTLDCMVLLCTAKVPKLPVARVIAGAVDTLERLQLRRSMAADSSAASRTMLPWTSKPSSLWHHEWEAVGARWRSVGMNGWARGVRPQALACQLDEVARRVQRCEYRARLRSKPHFGGGPRRIDVNFELVGSRGDQKRDGQAAGSGRACPRERAV